MNKPQLEAKGISTSECPQEKRKISLTCRIHKHRINDPNLDLIIES